MPEQETFLDTLVGRLRGAGAFNSHEEVAPAAVLWPDGDRCWRTILPRLRQRLPLLALGPFAPDERTGPAPWIRCAVDDAVREQTDPPVVYLPGIGARRLRDHQAAPDFPYVELLADLRFRGTLWTQPNGRDWTVGAFLAHELGVGARADRETVKAMERSLPTLADVPLVRLRAEAPWRAVDFDALADAAPFPSGPSIAELIAAGESATVEFKSSARWNTKLDRKDAEMEAVILKTVAAFLNSEDGGALLIGVTDGGEVCGVEIDFGAWSNPDKRNTDQYETWLLGDHLLSKLGMDCSPYVKVTFHGVAEKTVCKVTVRPGHRPVWVRDGKRGDAPDVLYVRTGNQSRPFSAREAVEYGLRRWPR